MRKAIRYTCLGAGAVLAVAGGIHAQTSPTVNWGGLYAGGNLGWGWTTVSPSLSAFGNYFDSSSVVSINRTARGQRLNGNGFAAGGQLGYNLQLGGVLLGVEGDLGWISARGTASSSPAYPCCAPAGYTLRQTASVTGLASLRGRVGLPLGNTLVYATGGLSYGELNYSRGFSDTFGAVSSRRASISATRSGWNAGGGVEYALSNSWSVKAEYLYHDLGSIRKTASATFGSLTLGATGKAEFQLQTARVGLNYRF